METSGRDLGWMAWTLELKVPRRQVAVVTGGTRGVGAGIARAFAAGRRGRGGLRPQATRSTRLRPAARVRTRSTCGTRPAVRRFFDGPRTAAGRAWSTTRAARPTGCSAEADAERHARVVELNLLAPLTASLAALRAAAAQRRRLGRDDRQRQRRAAPRPARRPTARPRRGWRTSPAPWRWSGRPRYASTRSSSAWCAPSCPICTTGTRTASRRSGRTVPLGRLAEPVGDRRRRGVPRLRRAPPYITRGEPARARRRGAPGVPGRRATVNKEARHDERQGSG